MNTWWRKIKSALTDESIRRRILYVLAAFVVFRLLAAIPIPGIDTLRLEQFFSNNQFLGLLNVFSGGGLSGLSLVMLGVGPYITASIAMQLGTVMIPRLKEMYHEEGAAGRRKFTQYSRLLTVPLAVIQGFSFLILLERQGIIVNLTNFELLVNVVIITGGALLLMWIGELMSEYGIGNGVSLLIFAGIVASLPQTVSQLIFTYDPSMLPTYIGFLLGAILIVFGVVVVTEAERPIPITYAKQVRGRRVIQGASTYLPLRINQAGVMPIIFALSILLFPQMIINFLAGSGSETVIRIADFFNAFYANIWLYGLAYFVLVFLFTYFYTAITFDPEATARNLQQSGAFVPGVRPGVSTAEHIGRVTTRITFVGGIFLGLIAVLPIIMQALTGVQTLAIGGTALLIVVAVVIDFLKRVDGQLALREY